MTVPTQQSTPPQLNEAPAVTLRAGLTPRRGTLGDWVHPTTILRVLLVLVIFTQLTLLLIALVPQSVWIANGYPSGPIPRGDYPVVAALFYVLPALTGALCRRWPAAVVLATLPAWVDLGAFAIAAASRIGPFYVAQQDHAVSTVGTLELFAALGALGWLARRALLEIAPRRWRDVYGG
jgi:hypothetical protein